jgi:hypothetical protein
MRELSLGNRGAARGLADSACSHDHRPGHLQSSTRMPLHSRGTLCPSFRLNDAPRKDGGRGESRVLAAPAASRPMEKGHEHSPQVQPEHSGLPRAMVYNFLRALPGVHDLFSHRRLEIIISSLDASLGASGPHAFAVRNDTVRPRKGFARSALRPSHPAPRIVTIASRPSCRGGTFC